MTALRIALFHNLTIDLEGGESLDLGSPTSKSLFAYLVLHRNQALDRRRLAFLFWPNTGESASRRNLRQYLHRIRRVIEPIDPQNALMAADGSTVSLSIPDPWWIDVAAFEVAATPPNQNLEAAVLLYRGDLLEEVYEEWVQGERDRLRRLYLECLFKLIEQHAEQGHYERAIHFAQQYLRAEPFLESAHVRLMELYHAQGDRNRVKRQYDQLAAMLKEEFAADPLPETTARYQQMILGTHAVQSGTIRPSATATASSIPTPPRPILNDPMAEPQLVGREEDLRLLNQHYQAARTASGSFLLIQGEMGIGKTRLINDWLAQLPATAYRMMGRGHEFESMIPYAPVIQALNSAENLPWELFQPAPPWLAPLLPLFPALAQRFPHLAVPNAANQVHIIQSLSYFLLTLARHRPLVLLLDNLHWADPSTWSFLSYMVQQIQYTQFLLIGTLRTEEINDETERLLHRLQLQPWVHRHTLPRLSLPRTAQLARWMMDDQTIEQRLIQRLYEETAGNPFFIVETLRAIRDAGGDWASNVPTTSLGERPSFAIPFKIQTVIESRLGQLDEESRMALSIAAAIGREFSFDRLLAIHCLASGGPINGSAETSKLLNILDGWLHRRLVRETPQGYDFTHEKLSQVAYNQLTRARRQHIHLQIANYLSQQQPVHTGQTGQTSQTLADPAQLARHYYLSSEPAKALPYLTQAGRRALAVRSYATAREYGLQALGLTGRFPIQRDPLERVDLNLQLAQAYAFSNQISTALELLQETERITQATGDSRRLAQIFHQSSQLFWLRGRPENASSYARRTLRYAEELDDASLRFAALRMVSRTAIALSQFDDAISYLLRYLDLAKRSPSPPAALPVIYGYLGVAYARVGSWERAIDAVERGVQLAEAERAGGIYVTTAMQKAFVYAELREWKLALAAIKPVYPFWQSEEMSPHAFMLRCVMGKTLSHLKADARSDHRPATFNDASAADAGWTEWTTVVQTTQGVGEIRAALAWAESVDYRVFRHVGLLFLAQALHAIADGAALSAAQVAEKEASDVGDLWATAVALRLQAEIDMRNPNQTDWPQAEAHLLAALDLLRQIRARPDLAHTYLTLRRLYDRAGQLAWAIDCHFRAITIFEELGMAEEVAAAQGQAPQATPQTNERGPAVVIHGLKLRGPNFKLVE